jgi:hypothetical protein
MRLCRTTNSTWHCEESKVDPYEPEYKLEEVTASFNRFGEGPLNKSDFFVEIKWSDIEDAIKVFYDMGRPEAVRLIRDRKMAKMIEQFLQG